MSTKEELLDYISKHRDVELPFNETVWDKAVEKMANKERKFKELREIDFDGNEKVTKIPNGAINPVSKYWQLIALPQYNKNEPIEDEERQDVDDDIDEELNDSEENDEPIEADADIDIADEDNEREFNIINWVNLFFTGYNGADKKFIKQRIGDYYDNYEINEGADKLIVTKAVADELEIMKLTKMRAKNKDIEKRLETVQKGYLNLLDSLKALKKQNEKMDEGKNKFTQWVDTMEKNKEFRPKKIEYKSDEIDNMIIALQTSIVEVMRNG
jgi:hypothetical protein